LLAVMIAALLVIAILDIGPLIGVGADATRSSHCWRR
jgi:hypothetical protein